MKVRNIFIIALIAVLGLSSCDPNKSKVEEMTNQFVTALQNNDVATIYDLYPDAKLVSNMKLPRVIQLADIDVEKDNATGNYTATIRNPREQKLEFKVVGNDQWQIVDSYGLFNIDEQYSDLAVKSGVPMKKLSDLALNSLFKEDSDFMKFFMKKFGQLTEMKLKRFDGVYNRQYSWVNIEQNIRNEGEFPVRGTNYDVVFHFTDNDGNSAPSTKTVSGVDLQPGETFTYNFQLEGYVMAAYNHALSWTVTFNQKGGNTLKDILKKAKFTGSEYTEFTKENKDVKKIEKK